MKILITGGAGFVGSTLADSLLSSGHQVMVIDNYSTGRKDNLKEHQNLTIIEGTIADESMVNQAFDQFKPDQVVHAAASYKDPEAWMEDAQTNVVGTINIVRASQKVGIKRIIYFQTALCYGLKPIEQPITFSHPLFSGGYEGGSSYAISKTTAEQYIELSGLNFISFRLANAYGPRNITGPLPTFYQRLSTGKKCFVMDTRRDFIFIDDLIECVVKAVDGAGDSGFYHISSGSDYSIKELFDATLSALDITLDEAVEVRERGDDDVFTILIDPSKTNQDFGWKVKTSLVDGVAKAIAYYEEYGIEETFTHLRLND
ncbi:MAG: UDP-glucose 4-epimerase [Parvicellaceae bacterium]|jgi:UDP-glucose 4-epimerase